MNFVLPFTFENLPVRGKLIRIDSALQDIYKNKNYPDQIKKILSEFAVFAIYFGSALKQKGSVSIQFQTSGSVNLIFMECTSDLKIRGIAKYDEDVENEEKLVIDNFKDARLAINIISLENDHTYQSLVPVSSNTVCEIFRDYIEQSEQIPTYLYPVYEKEAVCGVMLQYIPSEDIDGGELQYNSVATLESLIQVQNDLSFFNNSGNEILTNLFHEHELRVYKSSKIEMKCTCSRDKVRELILVLGEEDSYGLIQEKGQIKVDCEMCGKTEIFDKIDVKTIFEKRLSTSSSKSEH